MAMYGLRVYVGFTYEVLAVQGCWTLLGGSFMGLDNYFRGGYWIHRVCICNLTRFEQIFPLKGTMPKKIVSNLTLHWGLSRCETL